MSESKRLGVYVDTNSMQVAFMTPSSEKPFIVDIKKKFPVREHPLIYKSRTVVLSPAVSMEENGDVCILKYNVPMMLPHERIFEESVVQIATKSIKNSIKGLFKKQSK